MKIANITINDNTNFGNRLQLFAIQKMLYKYGQVFNIEWYNVNKKAKIIICKERIKNFIKFVLSAISCRCKRNVNFIRFNKNHLSIYHKKLFKDKSYIKINNSFDYFVCGSDQIWNPSRREIMYVEMLGFVDANKRVAVAPSVGIEDLTEEQKSEFKKYLKDFKYLSCREQQGADLIAEITGKPVTALLDPTLMLSAEEWLKIANKPKFHDANKKYILTYFLGNVGPVYQYIINKIKEKYNLEIINLMDKKSKYYTCGPSEFIYMIANASLVLTDSFHGSVFSYIFDKPFKIFKREDKKKSMNSRLVNLMDKLHLDESIYYTSGQSIDNLLETNYNKEYLKKEQKVFKEYLNKVFRANE